MPKRELVEYRTLSDNPMVRAYVSDYQCDVVGWALFCKGRSAETVPEAEAVRELEAGKAGRTKNDAQAQHPPMRGSKKPRRKGGLRPVRAKRGGLFRPDVKDIYSSKDSYVDHLRAQYQRDLEFYRAVLGDEARHTEIYPQWKEAGLFDSDLDREIDAVIAQQITALEKALREEAALILAIPDEDWKAVKASKYPKILLGELLGASQGTLRSDISSNLLVRMVASRVGQRPGFLSWDGPRAWWAPEDLQVQVDRIADGVLEQVFGAEARPRIEGKGRKEDKKGDGKGS